VGLARKPVEQLREDGLSFGVQVEGLREEKGLAFCFGKIYIRETNQRISI